MAPPKRAPKRVDRAAGKTRKEPIAPQTANEFLEAADEFEKAGGKWRPGDANKAFRFYQKAFLVYDEGLKVFPKDFDLAYNKAHLQYLILTDAKLKAQADGEPVGLLQNALDAHRYALKLDETNADILFNTAQVLTSLAEELDAEDDDGEEHADDEIPAAIGLLQEAIELFESCATRQEMQFEEVQAAREVSEPEPQPEDAQATPNTEDTAMNEDNSSMSEEWAVVTQAVTPLTLVETVTATLTTMTALVSAYSQASNSQIQVSSALAAVSSLGAKILDTKLPTYLRLLAAMPKDEISTDQSHIISLNSTTGMSSRPVNIDPAHAAQQEIALAAALFRASLAEAEYRLRLTSAAEYTSRLKETFEAPSSGLETTPSHLFAYADSLADFATAIAERDRDVGSMSPTARYLLVNDAWSALTLADQLLARVVDLLGQPGLADISPPAKSKVYLLRGDASLHRWRISRKDDVELYIKEDEPVLLKNAGVYYRGAAKLAVAEGDEEETGQEASIKAQIVARFMGEKIEIRITEDSEEVMSSMADEGLVEERDLEAIL